MPSNSTQARVVTTDPEPPVSTLVPAPPFETKTDHVIGILRRKGASLAEIMDVLGWKEHSVRALLTATIAKGRTSPSSRDALPASRRGTIAISPPSARQRTSQAG
jgi:hypothetical protein